jgi:hypothetical protein
MAVTRDRNWPMLLKKSRHAVCNRQVKKTTSQIGLQTAREHR